MNSRKRILAALNHQPVDRMPKGGYYFDRFESYPGASHPDLSTWKPPVVSESDLEHYHRTFRRSTELSSISSST